MPEPTTAARLSITPGARLWFEPIEWLRILGPLPPGVSITGEFAQSTVAVLFVSNAGSVQWFLDRYRGSIAMPRLLWICYPTRGRSDFTRAMLQTMLAAHRLRVVSEQPLNATWTALSVRVFIPR